MERPSLFMDDGSIVVNKCQYIEHAKSSTPIPSGTNFIDMDVVCTANVTMLSIQADSLSLATRRILVGDNHSGSDLVYRTCQQWREANGHRHDAISTVHCYSLLNIRTRYYRRSSHAVAAGLLCVQWLMYDHAVVTGQNSYNGCDVISSITPNNHHAS